MNRDISNRTLAILFVFSILVVFIGFIGSLNEFLAFSKQISGEQVNSAVGETRINITEMIIITLIDDSVNFGSGYREESLPSNVECNLSTFDTVAIPCWVNTTAYPPNNFSHFRLENMGNVFVNVTINSSNATDFFGNITDGTPGYSWSGIHVSGDDGCIGSNLTTTFNEFDNTEQIICSRMAYRSFANTFDISINLSIPECQIGQKSSEVTFVAMKVY